MNKLDKIKEHWETTENMAGWALVHGGLLLRAVRQLGQMDKYSRHWMTCEFIDEETNVCGCGWLAEHYAIDRDVLELIARDK